MVDVRGDVLRPPHGTTPAAVKWNKNLRSLVSDIHDTSEQTEESIPVLLSCTSDIDDTETVSIANPLLVPHENNTQINSDLNDGQKQDLECILEQFEDVLTDVPGKACLIQHDVKLLTDIPVCKKSLRSSFCFKRYSKERNTWYDRSRYSRKIKQSLCISYRGRTQERWFDKTLRGLQTTQSGNGVWSSTNAKARTHYKQTRKGKIHQ